MRLRMLMCVVVVASSAGCRSWRPVEVSSPDEYLAERAGEPVRITLRGQDLQPFVLDGWSRVGADSIRGRARTDSGGRTTRTISTADILRMDEQYIDPGRTVLAGLAIGGVVSLIAFVALLSSFDDAWYGTSGR